jgi:hypothetical protein
MYDVACRLINQFSQQNCMKSMVSGVALSVCHLWLLLLRLARVAQGKRKRKPKRKIEWRMADMWRRGRGPGERPTIDFEMRAPRRAARSRSRSLAKQRCSVR